MNTFYIQNFRQVRGTWFVEGRINGSEQPGQHGER